MGIGVRVDAVRTAYSDGNHNAFTDLCKFKGSYYLTFRNCPDGHMLFTTSRVLVLKSADTVSWEEVCAFNVPARDVRDPHFLIFKDKLFVLAGTWLVDPDDSHHVDMNEQEGYAVWSEDGETWRGPQMLEGTHGYFIWRAGACGDTAYTIGRCIHAFQPVADREEMHDKQEAWLLKSSDGLTWEPAVMMQSTHGDEIAFIFEPDDSMLAVARGSTHHLGQVWRARPPYKERTYTSLSRNVGGPMLAKWNGLYLVAGRKTVEPGNPVTTLYLLKDDALVEVADFPSGGDNSYPGFVDLDQGKAVVSYYSSHQGSGTTSAPAAIYLAELSLED